jgi:hypothetical protein
MSPTEGIIVYKGTIIQQIQNLQTYDVLNTAMLFLQKVNIL